MIIQVDPVVNYSVRTLCKSPYYNHPKGCPNFNKKIGCPPNAPLFDKYFDLNLPIYVIYNVFDFKGHIEKMRTKNPNWSEHQLKCVLYWQGSARKKLKEKCIQFLKEFKGYHIEACPEAMGVNVFETMEKVGVVLERTPKIVTYQVAMAGVRRF